MTVCAHPNRTKLRLRCSGTLDVGAFLERAAIVCRLDLGEGLNFSGMQR